MGTTFPLGLLPDSFVKIVSWEYFSVHRGAPAEFGVGEVMAVGPAFARMWLVPLSTGRRYAVGRD